MQVRIYNDNELRENQNLRSLKRNKKFRTLYSIVKKKKFESKFRIIKEKIKINFKF